MTASPGPVASAIRAELARRGRTQLQAAEHLGMAQQTFNARLCGRRSMRVDELLALAKWLDVPVERLMDEPRKPSRKRSLPRQTQPTAQAVPA